MTYDHQLMNTRQSNRVVLAKLGREKDFYPLTNFHITFADRQKLKRSEDLVTELEVIMDSMIFNIEGVRNQCMKSCSRTCLDIDYCCQCGTIVDELDQHLAEVQLYLKRCRFLKDKANSVSHLVRVSLPCMNVKETNIG